MKSLKLISLAITMLTSLVTFGQEKDTIVEKPNNKYPHSVTIRDMNSTNEKALFVVNGIIANELIISKIDSNNIESINVLKGENATSLYGYQGRNGVVIIKTKNRKPAKI
jgi:TonB-dependent SusC/RagA subfamily outer membrane receptor